MPAGLLNKKNYILLNELA